MSEKVDVTIWSRKHDTMFGVRADSLSVGDVIQIGGGEFARVDSIRDNLITFSFMGPVAHVSDFDFEGWLDERL